MLKLNILIPDGDNRFAVYVARCLSKQKNIELHVISPHRFPDVRFSKYIKSFEVISNNGNGKYLDEISRIIEERKINIIFPVDVKSIRFFSEHKYQFESLVKIALIPSTKMFDIAHDKSELSKFLIKNNLPAPTTIIYDGSIDKNILSKTQFPVLIKPTQSGGGIGIKRFESPSSLLEFLKKVKVSNKLVIQTFIEGYKLGCNVLCHDGEILAYTIEKQIISGYSDFGPAEGIQFLYNKEVHDVVKKLVHHLRWSGVANIDLKYDNKTRTINILELNPRYWGSLLGSLNAGVNFPHLACLAAMNIDFSIPKYKFKQYVGSNAAIKLFFQKGYKMGFKFSDTNLAFVIRDPFPALSNLFIRLTKKL